MLLGDWCFLAVAGQVCLARTDAIAKLQASAAPRSDRPAPGYCSLLGLPNTVEAKEIARRFFG